MTLTNPDLQHFRNQGVDLRELKRLMEQLNEQIPVMDEEVQMVSEKVWTQILGTAEVDSVVQEAVGELSPILEDLSLFGSGGNS